MFVSDGLAPPDGLFRMAVFLVMLRGFPRQIYNGRFQFNDLRAYALREKEEISDWFVVWSMSFIFHILGISSSKLTMSYFSEGLKPPSRLALEDDVLNDMNSRFVGCSSSCWFELVESISISIHSLHIITYHYISLHIITYHYISLHIITYHYISLHIITYHYISLHIITYHYML